MTTSPRSLLSVSPIPLRTLSPRRRATLATTPHYNLSNLSSIAPSVASAHSNQSSPPNTPAPEPSPAQPAEPPDWETIYTPLGTHYYYYHSGHKVVVDTKPDDRLHEHIQHATEGVVLPPKCEWFRRKDGNIFYINHVAETATHIIGDWVIPTEGRDNENLDARKSKYWEFVRKHPFHLGHFKHTVSKEAKTEALNALSLLLGMHALGPRQPIAPFSKSQCQEMREILTTDPPFQKGDKRFCKFEYRAYVVAAILEQIYAQRFWCKVQSKGEFVGAQTSKSWLMIMVKFTIYPLLLGLPLHHQKQIEKIKKVRIGKDEIPQHCRREIIEKTKTEHQISLVVAGLLLAAALAAMAIPGVDPRTLLFAGMAAQCGFSSVLINIAALWQYVGTLEDDVISGRHYFKRNVSLIACLQSLPFATLLWGLVFFGVAGCNFPFNAARRPELERDQKPELLLKPGQQIAASVTMCLLALAITVAIGDAAFTKYFAIKSEKAGIQQGVEPEVQIQHPTVQVAPPGARNSQRSMDIV